MSSLFDLPIKEVDLVFPSYQRLMKNLVELVHLLHARRKYDHTLLQLNWHYGYLLGIQPNFLLFAEHPEQAVNALKQLEQDLSKHGLLTHLRIYLQSKTSLMNKITRVLGLSSGKLNLQMQILQTITEIELSYKAIRAVWAGREVQRPKVVMERRKKHSTYLVLASLSS